MGMWHWVMTRRTGNTQLLYADENALVEAVAGPLKMRQIVLVQLEGLPGVREKLRSGKGLAIADRVL